MAAGSNLSYPRNSRGLRKELKRCLNEGRSYRSTDEPYGGGPGMIMRADILAKAFDDNDPGKEWEKIVSNLGITNEDRIIVYDNSDVISSCRCWYTFIFFGHNPNLISVLNGGLLKWKKENRETTNKVSNHEKKNYKAIKISHLVKSKEEIDKNILEKKFQVVDARSKNRFLGLEKEPRLGVRSGSIQNSYCLPFGELINPEDKTFIEKNLIKKKFTNIGINNEKNIVFSCGSGITASVLGLAYSIINDKYLPAVYDGSWAEYGKIK